MAIELNGTTGITTPGLINTGTETIVNLTTTGNTILGDASTDTLNVGNGGLVKDASGNVGIGTASPTEKVTVTGNMSSTANGTFYIDGTNAGTVANPTYSWVVDTDTGMYRIQANTIGFATAATERMRIDSSGNVNIAGLTASQAVFTNASKNLVSNAITGTGSVAMSTSPNINYANLYGASVYWAGVNGTTATSTGLNVNQSNGGRTILLLWSFSNGAGNNSASSIYMIRCGYDGDNYAAIKIAGDSVGSAAGRDVPTFSLVSSVLHIAALSAGSARVGWIANTG